jgi:hypothetical protein
MTYDHRSTGIHRAELDSEIESIRNERLLTKGSAEIGWAERARRRTGRVLIAAGTALVGQERTQLRGHRV